MKWHNKRGLIATRAADCLGVWGIFFACSQVAKAKTKLHNEVKQSHERFPCNNWPLLNSVSLSSPQCLSATWTFFMLEKERDTLLFWEWTSNYVTYKLIVWFSIHGPFLENEIVKLTGTFRTGVCSYLCRDENLSSIIKDEMCLTFILLEFWRKLCPLQCIHSYIKLCESCTFTTMGINH